ncbi:MAG: F0F1 ATP synthase subunit alpha, partial [Cyanobacteria bacterium PR.3.49]|nr:F0F1 ATP synthase subunit alpha [Cyanobacteria bacterium PR.3.49]
ALPISVSRVGGAAQTKAMKAVAGKLRLDLAQFRELEAFAQFASDLDKATQDQIRRGQKLTEVLKQPQFQPLSLAQQVSIIYAANNGLLDDVEQKDIQKFKAEWFKFLAAQSKDLDAKINSGDKLTKEDETALTDAIKNFKTNFFNK